VGGLNTYQKKYRELIAEREEKPKDASLETKNKF